MVCERSLHALVCDGPEGADGEGIEQLIAAGDAKGRVGVELRHERSVSRCRAAPLEQGHEPLVQALLPHFLEEDATILIEIKRKLEYNHAYISGVVRPSYVLKPLASLIQTPLYIEHNAMINESWASSFEIITDIVMDEEDEVDGSTIQHSDTLIHDDDEEEKDEDKEDHAGTSKHPGPDDDDQGQSVTSPSSGGTDTEPPPPPLASQLKPRVSKDIEPKQTHAIGPIGEGQLQTNAVLLTYKKRSTALVPSVKGKEMAISSADDSLSDIDMEPNSMLYTGVRQLAQSWKMVQYHGRAKCELREHPTVVQVLERVPEITLTTAVKDVNLWARQLSIDNINSMGIQVEMLLEHKPKYQCIQDKRNSLREGLSRIKAIREKKTVKELNKDLLHFRARMRFWKRHMHVLVKHTNVLLQLSIEALKILEKKIKNLASNEDTYREIGEILFEARIKSNQHEPAGWLDTASHYHKRAKARVTRGRKTLYCQDTKEWQKMTPYEQQMLVKKPEVLEQTVSYRIIKKQTATKALETATNSKRLVKTKEKKPPDKDKGKDTK
ncbi:hypothetical protein L7F22_058536 [Adiantum nelumboides]|nr:hypothetical protein [Adiantum nelumboides]